MAQICRDTLSDFQMKEYYNPVIYGDYSDPDPIRVGDDYYMVASSFTYLPGVPILHSKDLVHWEIINYAVRSLDWEKYQKPSHGSGTWAPSIRYHEGVFYVFIPLVDEGIMVARSEDIRGEFELNMLIDQKGWIDPCPIWTDDGKAYMVFAYAASRIGINSRIDLVEISLDCRRVIGKPITIFSSPCMARVSEGPKAYWRDGWYYVLFPAGGVEKGWQCCIRSRSIEGPYEYKVVMHQGSSSINGPHQGGWITAPDSSEWFIHFQDVGVLGRIINLEPLTMLEGWPMIGMDIDGDGIGEPVQHYRMPVDTGSDYSIPMGDEFEGETLGLQWQWQANPDDSSYSLSRLPGWLSLRCKANTERECLLWYAPNALTEIPQSDSFSLTCHLKFGEARPGDFISLGMIGHRYGYAGLYYSGSGYFMKSYKGIVTKKTFEGEAVERETETISISSDSLFIRMELRKDHNVIFSFSEDGENYHTVKDIFPIDRATWTGAKIALWACNRGESDGGWGEVEYIRAGR